jgi:DNA polymerase III beta subunit
MKFDVALPDLNNALDTIKDTLGKDAQGHEGIRIYASKKSNRIKLTTTDGSYFTEVWIPASVKASGKYVVKGKKFMGYAKKLDVDKVSLSIKDNGSIMMKSKRGQQTFQSFDEANFLSPPKLDSQFSFHIAGRVYKELINSVAFATDDAKSPSRPILAGIHIVSDGKKMELMTTNGNTVAHFRRKIKSKPLNVVLGKKSLVNSAKAVKDDERVTIQACDNNRFIIKIADISYYLPTLAGVFPNVRSILPKDDFDLQFTADKDEFLGILDRASLMLEGKGILHFEKGKVTLSGKSEDNDFSEYIMTKLQGDSDDIRVDIKQMAEIVKVIDSDMVHIGIRPQQPIVLRPEGKSAHTCILAVG